MTSATIAAWQLEARKLAGATVTRTATIASLALVLITSVGGYAAARYAGETDLGQKARSMLTAPGWDGYVGLVATSVGVVSLLAVGIVAAWASGREFADGTVVGLFALPTSTGAIGAAKVGTVAAWSTLLAALNAAMATIGGVLVGLPAEGAVRNAATVFVAGAIGGVSTLPTMWIATLSRGYLGGIAASLAIVVVTNLGAGFGIGRFIPWAIPSLWAMATESIAAPLLAAPLLMAAAGAALVTSSWARLQLGDR